ncbi:GNAT family N-acetyltransferase [Oxalobacteraceae bacterium]|nr:GNAT family N-acetyltransferase [Oxalobacteraceae bacterium]
MNSITSIHTRQASVADIEQLSRLFDGYRQFYGKAGDLDLARNFLLERFRHNQSTIFIAVDGEGSAVGFTQLYPSFSSVSAARIFILNDLFVVSAARGLGAGRQLLQAAAAFGRALGAVRLSLSTAVDNTAAQALYTSLGWEPDDGYRCFDLGLPA